MLSMPEIIAEVHRLAAMIGATERQLPTFGYTDDGARPHIEVDANHYHFIVVERGQEYEHITTANLDELLYHVFDSVTFGLSTTYASGHRKPDEEFRRPLFARQEQLLGTLSPAWAARKAAEHAKVLRDHPFEDAAASRPQSRVQTIESSDRTFVIQTSDEQDERGAPMFWTRITDRATQSHLLDLQGYEAVPPIRFPAFRQTDLTLRGGWGEQLHLHIDLQANHWHPLPIGKPRPLSELAAGLSELRPTLPRTPNRITPGQRLKQLLGDLLLTLISAGFTVGGVWLALRGKTASDRLAGVTSVILFGLGAIVYGRSLQNRIRSVRSLQSPKAEPAWAKFASFLPLIGALAEVPWCIVCFFGFLFLVGDKPFTSTPGSVLLTKLIFPVPAVLGLLLGLLAVAAGLVNTWARRTWLVIGMISCGLIVLIDLLGYIR